MGYDLYGLNPNNPNNTVKPEHFDWNDPSVTDEVKNKYYDELRKYESEVVGSYFRSNVWYWRPLWNFVTAGCSDILSEKDIEGGYENGGHRISKTKSKRMASRIRNLIKIGAAESFEELTNATMEKAREHNKNVDREMQVLREEVAMNYGEGLVPRDYPEPFKSKWDKIQSKRNWSDSYPFSAEFLNEFASFCDQSGGFEIC